MRQPYDGDGMALLRRAVEQDESSAWSVDAAAAREFLAMLRGRAPALTERIAAIETNEMGFSLGAASLVLVLWDVLHQGQANEGEAVEEIKAWGAVRRTAAGGHSSTTEDTQAFEQLLDVLALRAGVSESVRARLISHLGLGDGDSVEDGGDPYIGLGVDGAKVLLKLWDYVRELPTSAPAATNAQSGVSMDAQAPDPVLVTRINEARGLSRHESMPSLWDRETTQMLLADATVRRALCPIGPTQGEALAISKLRERVVKVLAGGAWSPGEYKALADGFDAICSPLTAAEQAELARVEAEVARLEARKAALVAKAERRA